MNDTLYDAGLGTKILVANDYIGLPQGSVLVTQFFPLFVLYIALVILFCKSTKFSDDFQIYAHCRRQELDDTVREIGSDAQRGRQWSTDRKILLNRKKSVAIIIGNSRILGCFDRELLPRLTDHEEGEVEYHKSVRSLGIIIDENLNFKKHIENMCTNTNRKFYQSYTFRNLLEKQTRIKIMNQIILPELDNSLVVTIGISGELDLQLQKLQNRGVRFILGLSRDCHITQHRRSLGWLSIRDRRHYFALCLLYNAHHYGVPIYINELFQYNIQPTTSRLRGNRIPARKTDLYKNSFLVETPRLWNELPTDIIESDTF